MADATNAQMQSFADARIRPFAEAARALLLSANDHKAALDDVYARASGTSAWTDARTDGPPHLLAAGNSASPDDVLNFNAFLTKLQTFFTSTAASEWGVLARACVRPPG